MGTGSLGNSNSNNNEEEEAHLMHLVSVLRDLITCRLEQITDGNDDSAASLNNPKLIDLHSNVINLLTNMPSTCYEELLSPLNPLPSNVSTVSNSNAPMSNIENQPTTNYYLNVRMAHNRKRISRRSKRMKQQQQQKQQQQLDEMKMKQNLEDLTLAIGIQSHLLWKI